MEERMEIGNLKRSCGPEENPVVAVQASNLDDASHGWAPGLLGL